MAPFVAVKSKSTLELFVNGKSVDRVENSQPTPPGWRVLLGRFYVEELRRLFVGELDEVAIYDRALDAKEIAKHFELVRSGAAEQ